MCFVAQCKKNALQFELQGIRSLGYHADLRTAIVCG